jgi:phage shock protein PspC (stress-responsive transcriptional regulator)
MSTPPAPPAAPETPPDPPGPAPRRLTRSSSDQVLGGVAGGLGRYFDIDPIIFRIGFVVLTLAGGAGFIAYVAAWLLVPADPVPGETPAGGPRLLTYLGAAILVVAALLSLGHGIFSAGPPLVGLGLIALLAVALWRAAEDRGGDGRAVLRRAAIGLGLIVVAGITFVAAAFGTAAGGGAVIAGLIIALGGGLALTAFTGGMRWLAVPALLLAVPLGFVAASGADVKGGSGERDYHPTSVAELQRGYHLGVGDLRVDLRGMDLPSGRTPLKVDLGIGSVRVFVPEDVCVASDMRVGVGYSRVLDRDNGGFDVDWRHSPREDPDVKRLVIDGHVGIGALQVVHQPWEIGNRFADAGGQSFASGTQDDAACEATA